MTTLIEQIKELDAKRTQGDWIDDNQGITHLCNNNEQARNKRLMFLAPQMAKALLALEEAVNILHTSPHSSQLVMQRMRNIIEGE